MVERLSGDGIGVRFFENPDKIASLHPLRAAIQGETGASMDSIVPHGLANGSRLSSCVRESRSDHHCSIAQFRSFLSRREIDARESGKEDAGVGPIFDCTIRPLCSDIWDLVDDIVMGIRYFESEQYLVVIHSRKKSQV